MAEVQNTMRNEIGKYMEIEKNLGNDEGMVCKVWEYEVMVRKSEKNMKRRKKTTEE